jgi:hypothetical protein
MLDDLLVMQMREYIPAMRLITKVFRFCYITFETICYRRRRRKLLFNFSLFFYYFLFSLFSPLTYFLDDVGDMEKVYVKHMHTRV